MGVIHRVAVVDENGVNLNIILLDSDLIPHFWPGYGAGLVDLGPAPTKNLEPQRNVNLSEQIEIAKRVTKPAGFVGEIKVKPDDTFEHGDRIDKTGRVQKGVVTDMEELAIAAKREPIKKNA